ncbi:MAG: DUF1553 domain-containing protein [Planctomycetia bacterium]|nr:DUF1553 domain-containing protein [Planctomycetia bacterium]
MNGRVLASLALTLLAGPAFAAEPSDGPRKLAGRIDRLLAARWTDERVVPVGRSEDAEFLRRAYLDLTGKIPPVGVVRCFLADPAPDKRRVLIERLLDGPGYVTHFSALWRELLVLDPDADSGRQAALADLERWLHRQFAANVPYDRLARELLTLSLEAARPKAGAEPLLPTPRLFYLGREEKPEELAAGMTRVFLGIRLECAQCHNHPHAKWTREHFWSQAALFAGLNAPEVRRELMIPGTEQKVAARFLDGSALPAASIDPRAALADWMTAPRNPFFARAAVNRLWEHFFGIGIVDPVDDMTTENEPSHPELLAELATAFEQARYDLKFLIRALMLSDAYQLTSVESRTPPPSDARFFSRMNVKALRPAEVFDSIIEATGYRPADLARQRARLLARFPRVDRRLEGQGSIPQALALMNGELLTAATRPGGDHTLGAVLASPFLDTEAKIETLFLAALGRPPRAAERDRLVRFIADAGDNRERAFGDVLWALLNSAEFIHNH